MRNDSRFHIAVLPGDGIGHEVMPACLEVLNAAAARLGGFGLDYDIRPAGAESYRDTGQAIPPETANAVRRADAILLGAMGLPSVRRPDGTEITPQIDLRMDLGLYAGVRPVSIVNGAAAVLADPRAAKADFVLIRESTEGLFASRGKGKVIDDREAHETLVITRGVSERLFDFAFSLARKRKQAGSRGEVICVDKANVFASFAFFRKIFNERAALNTDIGASAAYVDALAMFMVRRPWELDVLVTENMFGDILSDLGAALMGGLGFAPSADIGDEFAVFQPCHGTAPDIAGQGKANPIAMFLSGAMMLDWLGDRETLPEGRSAADLIRRAVTASLHTIQPIEVGGSAGTATITRAVLEAIGTLPVEEEAGAA
jgi:3-isopropylmalate dehydrogenase